MIYDDLLEEHRLFFQEKEETRSAAAIRRNEFKVCPLVCVSVRNTRRDLVAHDLCYRWKQMLIPVWLFIHWVIHSPLSTER